MRGDPEDDALFAAAVVRYVARMPDPTPEGLALRLRHLYPHARVEMAVDGWVAYRDSAGTSPAPDDWWTDPFHARVRYDENALIVWANPAAVALLGMPLVGRHWQELVTPTTEDDVMPALAVIRDTGVAISRFRMPRADGSLFELDSYTHVDDAGFETVLRPAAAGA